MYKYIYEAKHFILYMYIKSHKLFQRPHTCRILKMRNHCKNRLHYFPEVTILFNDESFSENAGVAFLRNCD